MLVQATSLQLCLYAQSFARQMQILFPGKHHTGAIQVSVELQDIHLLPLVSIALNATTSLNTRTVTLTQRTVTSWGAQAVQCCPHAALLLQQSQNFSSVRERPEVGFGCMAAGMLVALAL